jgi:outer membrane protein OmpA-like peptidoglycan-associated protein
MLDQAASVNQKPQKASDHPPTPSTTHFERNFSLDLNLDIAPRRSVVIRRPRRDVSLDFAFEASPRLSLFSGPSQTRMRLAFIGDVLFPFEKDVLTLGARRRLDEVARRIQMADPTWVYVYGHADEKGAHAGNWGLSDRRARAVRRGLVHRHAVNRSQILMGSFGETWPAVCGTGGKGFDDPRSRVYNRRVEIYTGQPPAASDLHCPRPRR